MSPKRKNSIKPTGPFEDAMEKARRAAECDIEMDAKREMTSSSDTWTRHQFENERRALLARVRRLVKTHGSTSFSKERWIAEQARVLGRSPEEAAEDLGAAVAHGFLLEATGDWRLSPVENGTLVRGVEAHARVTLPDARILWLVALQQGSTSGKRWLAVIEAPVGPKSQFGLLLIHEKEPTRTVEAVVERPASTETVGLIGNGRAKLPALIEDRERAEAVRWLATTPGLSRAVAATRDGARSLFDCFEAREERLARQKVAASRRWGIERHEDLYGGDTLVVLRLDFAMAKDSIRAPSWFVLSTNKSGTGQRRWMSWCPTPFRASGDPEFRSDGQLTEDVDDAALLAAITEHDEVALSQLLNVVGTGDFWSPDARNGILTAPPVVDRCVRFILEQDQEAHAAERQMAIHVGNVTRLPTARERRAGNLAKQASPGSGAMATQTAIPDVVMLTVAVPADREQEFRRLAARACEEHRSKR